MIKVQRIHEAIEKLKKSKFYENHLLADELETFHQPNDYHVTFDFSGTGVLICSEDEYEEKISAIRTIVADSLYEAGIWADIHIIQ